MIIINQGEAVSFIKNLFDNFKLVLLGCLIMMLDVVVLSLLFQSADQPIDPSPSQ